MFDMSGFNVCPKLMVYGSDMTPDEIVERNDATLMSAEEWLEELRK